MNHKRNLVQFRLLSGPRLQHRLLVELDDLFREIEDGTVKENTFTGCIAIEQRDLSPLNENQSKQIKEALLRTPVAPNHSTKSGVPILSSMFNFIRNLWGSHATNGHPAPDGAKSISLLLYHNGRVKSKDTFPIDRDQNGQAENQEIQESDVKQFFVAKGEDYTWVLPYAWDISNRLDAVKKSEIDGDLALFLERRRRLNVRRPKSTLFEQSVQRYAAKVSELYCDEKGDITDEKALAGFISDLVNTLLENTKAYWPTSPPLAIFDGLVSTVMRPLLHKHQTIYYPNEITTATRAIVSGNTMGKIEKLVTIPKWNETSQRLVQRYVKTAFKKQVWNFFLDRYAPYNLDYSKSPHLDTATLTNVGLLIKNFGDPIHLRDIMELLQPTNQADALAQYVVDHFRSGDFIDH